MASITVRIPDELKKEVEDADVEIDEVTRRALEEEVERIKAERAREAAEKLGNLLSDIPDEEIIKAIRETRDQRLGKAFRRLSVHATNQEEPRGCTQNP